MIVSAVSVDSGSAAQSKARSTQFDLDSPGLACSVLVCRSTQTIAGEEACTSLTAKAVDSTQVGNSTFKSSAAQAHRLEAVKRRLDAIGASKAAIDFVTKAHRSSTKSVYDSHWRAWNAWCLDNGIDPLSPNEIQLANLLAFLATVKSLSAAALRVRRAAIQTTLRQLGSCTTEDSLVVSNVIRGVALQNARSPRRVPMWDLRLVLDLLQSSQFEPLHKADMLHLTQKTVFLVALACGRRSREIHSIAGRSSGVAFTRQTALFCASYQSFSRRTRRLTCLLPL